VGGSQLIARVIKMYLDVTPGKLAEMRAALAAGDAAALTAAAHFLKSGSASLGLLAFAELHKSIERLGKAGNLRSAALAVSRLDAQYAAAAHALQQVAGAERTSGSQATFAP
ncbi:MAG: Hpt domain-containing protein, partial [Propionivibrio sp.]